jgi:hypothetical protein
MHAGRGEGEESVATGGVHAGLTQNTLQGYRLLPKVLTIMAYALQIDMSGVCWKFPKVVM